jgi:capsular polysaccharide biosynthesis protein
MIRFLGCAAVAGLVLGGAIYKVHPPAYQASTSVLVAQNPALNPLDAVQTDVALARSRSVAGPVMRKLGLTENVTKFIGSYTVVAVTDRVLVIIASAPSSAQAVAKAAALAAEFLQFRAHELRVQQHLVASSLDTDISRAKQHLAAIVSQMAQIGKHVSSGAQRLELSALQVRRRQAVVSLTALQQAESSYQGSSQVTTASIIAGSRVLDAAAPLPRSKLRSPELYVVAGLLAGLLVGIAIVTIGELVSDRLRRRDDIAIALGAPVELSAGPPPRRWPRGLAAAQDPGIQRIVGYLSRAVAQARAGDIAALAVVALDERRVAALSVASLSVSLAGAGKRVLVADLAPGAPAARLLGVRAPGVVAVTVGRQRLAVVVPERGAFACSGPVEGVGRDPIGQPAAGTAVASALAAAYDEADVLVCLVTLDPAVDAAHLPP